MSIHRFRTDCERCGASSPEYQAWPTCEDCLEDICPGCSDPEFELDEEHGRTLCKFCRFNREAEEAKAAEESEAIPFQPSGLDGVVSGQYTTTSTSTAMAAGDTVRVTLEVPVQQRLWNDAGQPVNFGGPYNAQAQWVATEESMTAMYDRYVIWRPYR